MEDNEFQQRLWEKLIEESIEVQEANNPQDLIEEIADVVEVLSYLDKKNNISIIEIILPLSKTKIDLVYKSSEALIFRKLSNEQTMFSVRDYDTPLQDFATW